MTREARKYYPSFSVRFVGKREGIAEEVEEDCREVVEVIAKEVDDERRRKQQQQQNKLSDRPARSTARAQRAQGQRAVDCPVDRIA